MHLKIIRRNNGIAKIVSLNSISPPLCRHEKSKESTLSREADVSHDVAQPESSKKIEKLHSKFQIR
jgi:hypothetical protein